MSSASLNIYFSSFTSSAQKNTKLKFCQNHVKLSRNNAKRQVVCQSTVDAADPPPPSPPPFGLFKPELLSSLKLKLLASLFAKNTANKPFVGNTLPKDCDTSLCIWLPRGKKGIGFRSNDALEMCSANIYNDSNRNCSTNWHPVTLPVEFVFVESDLISICIRPMEIKKIRKAKSDLQIRTSHRFVESDESQSFKHWGDVIYTILCLPRHIYEHMSAVSGLNRGLAASEDDVKKADAAAKELEAMNGPVDLSVDLDKLQGRWKLLYSSAFSSRNLGGSRPGPSVGRLLPITLGQVFQRIDILSKDFDNIVELQLGTPWPIPPVEVTATLAHKFEVKGSSAVKIIFEKTTVKTRGELSQLPSFEIPQLPNSLKPRSRTGSGEFEVTFLDSDTRITRGDRGELRVFVIA